MAVNEVKKSTSRCLIEKDMFYANVQTYLDGFEGIIPNETRACFVFMQNFKTSPRRDYIFGWGGGLNSKNTTKFVSFLLFLLFYLFGEG